MAEGVPAPELTPTIWLARAASGRVRATRDRVGTGIAVFLGLIPVALVIALFHHQGYGDLPILASLYVGGPTIAVASWCAIGREWADARELLIWLTAVPVARSRIKAADASEAALDASLEEATQMVAQGDSAAAVLQVVRAAVVRAAPLRRPRRFAVFVLIWRYFPALWTAAVMTLLMAAFVVILLVTPPCGTDPLLQPSICH